MGFFEKVFRPKPARAAGEALFAAAADQARNPVFYTKMGTPDTVEGRFEMTVLHAWMVMRKLKGEDRDVRAVAQNLFDVMFASFDDALREMGVGDLVVGKKIRKLAENFYGRVQAYDAAMAGSGDDDIRAGLAAALARNVYGSAEPQTAQHLADYVKTAAAAVDAQMMQNVMRGEISFPDIQS